MENIGETHMQLQMSLPLLYRRRGPVYPHLLILLHQPVTFRACPNISPPVVLVAGLCLIKLGHPDI